MHKRTALLLGMLGILLVAITVHAADGAPPPSITYAIKWWVMGGGGGMTSSASYKLNGTVGQGMVGAGTSGSYSLRTGFWAGFPGEIAGPTPTLPGPYRLRLPTIIKGA